MASVVTDTRIASEQSTTAAYRPQHALIALRRVWTGPDGALHSRRVFLNPFNVPGSSPVEIGSAVEGAPPTPIRPLYRRIWTAGGAVMTRWMFGTGQPIGVTRIEALGAPSNTTTDSAVPFEFGEEQQGPPIPVEWGAGRRSEVAASDEWLVAARGDAEEVTEHLASQRQDMAIPAEDSPGVGVSRDTRMPTESAAGQRGDCNTQVETSWLVCADPGMLAETAARLVADLRLTDESALQLLFDRDLPGETALRAQFEPGAALAALAAALSQSVIGTENLGAAVAVADRPLAVESVATLSRDNRSVVEIFAALMGFALFAAETARSAGADAAARFESAAAAMRDTSGPVGSLLDLVARFDLSKELQLAQRSDRPARIEAELLARGAELVIEHLGSAAESRLSVEFAARFLVGHQLLGGWAARFGSEVLVSINEWVTAAHASPAQPVAESGQSAIEWRASAPAPLLQLGEGRRLATPGRVRLLKGPSGMRLPTAFDPINSDETDNFAFDFTGDIGAAAMVSTRWTCSLAPYQTAVDTAPHLRILSTSLQTKIQIRDPLTGALMTRAGNFSVASIGGIPPASIGSTYVLTAFITLSDGRTVSLSSTTLCTAA